MVFLLRDVRSNDATGVLRVFLSDDGAEIGRRVLGAAWSSAIKIDGSGTELCVAVGVEQAIRHRAGPTWALLTASALAQFPVIDVVQSLKIMGDDARAIEACATRWREAGREVAIINDIEHRR